MPREHKQRHIVAAILDDVWGIVPEKLQAIVAFLELRAAGQNFDPDELRAIRATQPTSFLAASHASSSSSGDDRVIVDGVEVLTLFGTMVPRANMLTEFSGGTSTQKLGMAFDRAAADPNVKTVLLEVDSPGGVMSGTEELRQKLLALASKKRVVAVARGSVASAAYYPASGVELVATPSTSVGSIGVFMVTTDATKYYDELGVKFTVWRAGDLKAAGTPYESLTPERAASIQAKVDAPYQMFINAVAENRGVSRDVVLKTYGQGTTFMADEALRRGMIDRVAAIETVFDELRQESLSSQSTTFTALPRRRQESPARAEQTTPNPERSTMPPRIKAALYALNLIDDQQASDDVCRAALNGYFRARGQDVPQDDKEILRGLTLGSVATSSPPATSSTSTPPTGSSNASSNDLAAVNERERREALQADRRRCAEIRARAQLLGSQGFRVTPEAVAAAELEGLTVAEAVDRWTAAPSSSSSGNTTSNDETRGVGRVTPTGSEVDTFHAAAVDAFVLRQSRQGFVDVPQGFQPRQGATELARARTMDIVRRDMQLRGVRVDSYATDEDLAADWMEGDGRRTRLYGAEGGVNQASYPNLLSAWTNKALVMVSLERPKYRAFAAQAASVPDFNPRLIVGMGELGYLPTVPGDGTPFPETSFGEEALGWFQTEIKGASLKLTPYMVTQDQLGAFIDSFAKLQRAQDQTIDRLAFDLLASNPTLLDGIALFHSSSHGANLITSGGAPTATGQAKNMRLALQKQPGVNTSDYIEAEVAVVLVPLELEDDAKQQYYSIERLNEVKTPATDTTINVYRGKAEVVSSGRLSRASAQVWYALADPALFPVVQYCYQTGYEGGKRETYYDPKTKCRYFDHETRLAVFIRNWRGAAMNDGS